MNKNKCEELLSALQEQKVEMNDYLQSKPHEQASLYWETVSCNLLALIERIKVTNPKTQHLQTSHPANEKDIVNLMKMLELIYAYLMDYTMITKGNNQPDSNVECNRVSFASQLYKVKEQIDLLSIEMTKLKTVNEMLDTVVTNYKLELTSATSDQEHGEEYQQVQN